MKEQLEQRLAALNAEYESGQKMLADLEVKKVNLCETLLRISGAIQVLGEELAQDQEPLPKASPVSIAENGALETCETIAG